jgi:hypothetical protein
MRIRSHVVPIVALLLAIPAVHAGTESQPDLTSPVNPNVDHWADATKFWVNETNGELQFWEEDAPATAPQDMACESADPFNCPTGSAYKQQNANFAFLMGFTIDGQPWHVIFSADPDYSPAPPAANCDLSNTAAITRSATFVTVYQGDKKIWGTDVSTVGYSKYAPWVSSQGALERGIRWTTYTATLQPGAVLKDLWGAAVVRCPQPGDKVPFSPCPVLPVFADQATDCVTSTNSYTLQGGRRAIITDVSLTVQPNKISLGPGSQGKGSMAMTNNGQGHETLSPKALAPKDWAVTFSGGAQHVAPGATVSLNWTLAVPPNATPGDYNVTLEVDDGYAVRDATLAVTIQGGAAPTATTTSTTETAVPTLTSSTTSSSTSAKATPTTPALVVIALAVVLLARRRP